MRNTNGRYLQAEGIAVPKPEGKKELGVFQKQERSQYEYNVTNGQQIQTWQVTSQLGGQVH